MAFGQLIENNKGNHLFKNSAENEVMRLAPDKFLELSFNIIW